MKKPKRIQRAWMLREPLRARVPLVHERGLVQLDTNKLREQALKSCARSAKAFEKDDQALKAFEQGDIPAFDRWKAKALGPLLADLLRCEQELREAEYFRDIAFFESRRTRRPPWLALQKWREEQERRRNNPEPEPPPPEDDFDGDFEDLPRPGDPNYAEKMREFIRNSPLGGMAEDLGINFDDMPFDEPPDFGPARRPKATQPPQSASAREVYRKLCRLLHPDAVGEMTEERRAIWHQVQEAYTAGDVARLDTLLARVEQADGSEHRPRTISEILGMKKHYERARQKLRSVLHGARMHPAWQFLKRDEKSRAHFEQQARRDITNEIAFLRRDLAAIRMEIDPPTTRSGKPKKPKHPRTDFGLDDLF